MNKSKKILNKKVIRVFLSVPMNGRTSSEVILAFANAKSQLRELFVGYHIEFLSGAEKPDDFFERMDRMGLTEMQRRLYMASDSVNVLSTCDFVYFADGYEAARGCMLEYAAAQLYMNPVNEEKTLFAADSEAVKMFYEDNK